LPKNENQIKQKVRKIKTTCVFKAITFSITRAHSLKYLEDIFFTKKSP